MSLDSVFKICPIPPTRYPWTISDIPRYNAIRTSSALDDFDPWGASDLRNLLGFVSHRQAGPLVDRDWCVSLRWGPPCRLEGLRWCCALKPSLRAHV